MMNNNNNKALTLSSFLTAVVLSTGCSVGQELPTVTVTADNTRIDKSCEIAIPPGTVIVDGDGNGVIHIAADDITVRFADGAELRGSNADTAPNQYTGWGVRLDGHTGVTIENARVHGYRVALYATDATGLTLAGGDFSDNYRARLTSTVQREGGGDWLSPHNNDNNEWLRNYAAAIYIEDSDNITVRDIRIRQGQHGVLLDRVNQSAIYDNDVSFISGWGLALWRSSDNMISRNAFDFCVRGHSEGIYNRGQDSAGILFFEQCNRNVVAENSATHGGDGFFGFSGLEALGVPEKHKDGRDYKRLGCNDNIFIRNDFSYAPAHGLEMTFGFGNIIKDNRFVENAICGIWGGFSQDTWIEDNTFVGNGGMAYGMERGGINIEHSINNVILDNRFENNRVGVSLWYDDPGQIATLPWGQSNYGKLTGNYILDNKFIVNDEPQPFYRMGENEKRVAILLRDDGQSGKLAPVVVAENGFDIDPAVGQELALWDGTKVTDQIGEGVTKPRYEVPQILGDNRPVGARKQLYGRQNIIMGEWGPWDHQGILVRPYTQTASGMSYQVFGTDGKLNAQVQGDGVSLTVQDDPDIKGAKRVTLTGEPGVHAYTLSMSAGDWSYSTRGTLLSTRWEAVAFNYPAEDDPREDYDAWVKHAESDKAIRFTAEAIDFPFGGGGISDQALSDEVRAARLSPDYFGVLAKTEMPLSAGTWKITTVTDDGIRIKVNGEMLIDEWTWHAQQTDSATFTLDQAQDVTIEMAYFELNGGATLSVKLEPVGDAQ